MQANPDAKFYIVMRWAPRWIGRLEKLPLLSPSEKLLMEYKKGGSHEGDWNYYIPIFTQEMQSTECQEKMKEIVQEAVNRDVFLVCSEKPPNHCHRFLLMDMMNGERING